MVQDPGIRFSYRPGMPDVFIATLVLIAVDLAIVGVAAWLSHLAGRRPFPGWTDAELGVLGCLWQLPREHGESRRSYGRRLAAHINRCPRD